jgi:hypothetical protein
VHLEQLKKSVESQLGSSLLFMMKVMIMIEFELPFQDNDPTHSFHFSFAFGGTETTLPFKVVLWRFLFNLID